MRKKKACEFPEPPRVSWFVPVCVEVKARTIEEAEHNARTCFKNPGTLALIGVPFTKGENYIDWQKKK